MSGPNKTILVADPDPEMRAAIGQKIRADRLGVIEASSGQCALKKVRESSPHLVVTELFLPDITGLNLCRRIREDPDLPPTPCVILSAHADEMDRIISFEAGVDDFVAKPVSPSDLMARLRAILRRTTTDRSLPTAERTLPPTSEPLDLSASVMDATPRELQILTELMRQGGRVVTREHLLKTLWPTGMTATPRAIDAHIKSLRRKMGEARDRIRTVRGVGYRYEDS